MWVGVVVVGEGFQVSGGWGSVSPPWFIALVEDASLLMRGGVGQSFLLVARVGSLHFLSFNIM